VCDHPLVAKRGVRVIAGAARGRRLRVPVGSLVRPTSDRVKEAVFSALDSRGLLGAASVLDLWAGSGALAIEALSRGAGQAVLVERAESAVEAIRANLDACRLADRARVVRSDVADLAAGGPLQEAPFDLVFADPPYEAAPGTLGILLHALGANGLCAEGGCVVFECRSGAVPAVPGPWRVLWQRSFGDTLVLFLAA